MADIALRLLASDSAGIREAARKRWQSDFSLSRYRREVTEVLSRTVR
jgi:hypothetical protein